MTQESDFNNNITKLTIGTVLTTANRKTSEIIEITYENVTILIHKSRKKRIIKKDDVRKVYIHIRQDHRIENVTGSESIESIIGKDKRDFSYVWAILSKFDDIKTNGKQLFYKS